MMDTLSDEILSDMTSGMDKLNLSSTSKSLRRSMRKERVDLKRLHKCYNLRDNLVSCMNLAQTSEFEIKNPNSFGACQNIASVNNSTLNIRLVHSFLASNQCAFILAMRYATSRKRIKVYLDRDLEDNEIDQVFLSSVNMLPLIHMLYFKIPDYTADLNITNYINRFRNARARAYTILPTLDSTHTGNPTVFAYTFDYFLNNPQEQTRLRDAIRHTTLESNLTKTLHVIFLKNDSQMNAGAVNEMISFPLVTLMTNASSDTNFHLITDAQSIRTLQTEDDYGRHYFVHTWWDVLSNLPGHRERNQSDIELDDDVPLENNDRNGGNVLILSDDADIAYLMGLGMYIFDGLKVEFERLPATNFFALQYLDTHPIPGKISN